MQHCDCIYSGGLLGRLHEIMHGWHTVKFLINILIYYYINVLALIEILQHFEETDT